MADLSKRSDSGNEINEKMKGLSTIASELMEKLHDINDVANKSLEALTAEDNRSVALKEEIIALTDYWDEHIVDIRDTREVMVTYIKRFDELKAILDQLKIEFTELNIKALGYISQFKELLPYTERQIARIEKLVADNNIMTREMFFEAFGNIAIADEVIDKYVKMGWTK